MKARYDPARASGDGADERAKRIKAGIIGALCARFLTIAVLGVFFVWILKGDGAVRLSELFGKDVTYTVGTNISEEDMSAFWYTLDSSAYPPSFQRYHFYKEDGGYFFRHETREGDVWPLTEEHVTVTGTLELSEQEWHSFFDLIEGGSVNSMDDDEVVDGDSGPWLYLYWSKDRGKYRSYSFPDLSARLAFEEYCADLAERTE